MGETVKQTEIRFRAGFVEPMLCAPVKGTSRGSGPGIRTVPDGYRALGSRAKAIPSCTRGMAKTSRPDRASRALDALPTTPIDGEVVAVDESGRPSFSSLQNFDRAPVFYAFDLPALAGEDLKRRPLDERRKALRKLTRALDDPIRLSETFDASSGDMIAVVRDNGLEGVVAKRRDSLYEPGRRSGAWIKLRVNRRQDFLVGGYVPRSRTFDSILVGYHEGSELRYAGQRSRRLHTGIEAGAFLELLETGRHTVTVH